MVFVLVPAPVVREHPMTAAVLAVRPEQCVQHASEKTHVAPSSVIAYPVDLTRPAGPCHMESPGSKKPYSARAPSRLGSWVQCATPLMTVTRFFEIRAMNSVLSGISS